MPPVGTDLILNTAQVRYCVAQQIRVEGVRSVVDNNKSHHVNRFNEMIDDYNSRCGQFRYRKGTLEGASADIEPLRGQLQSQARLAFLRGQNPRTASQPKEVDWSQFEPADPSRAVVASIQRRLIELGYEPGVIDGRAGRATRTAIIEFQQEHGIVADGVPSEALLRQLETVEPRN